jgi:hypothetical protein
MTATTRPARTVWDRSAGTAKNPSNAIGNRAITRPPPIKLAPPSGRPRAGLQPGDRPVLAPLRRLGPRHRARRDGCIRRDPPPPNPEAARSLRMFARHLAINSVGVTRRLLAAIPETTKRRDFGTWVRGVSFGAHLAPAAASSETRPAGSSPITASSADPGEGATG